MLMRNFSYLLVLVLFISIDCRNQFRPQRRMNCSQSDALFQWDNFDLSKLSICESDSPWRFAQLTLPEATVFIDVGGNRGYTAALMFGLWSPGHGFNRISLREAITKDFKKNLTTNSDQLDTFCSDGLRGDSPIICIGQDPRDPHRPARQCFTRRSLQVYSFDGELSHVKNQRLTIYKAFPFLHPNASGKTLRSSNTRPKWEYVHAAVTSAEIKGNATVGYFEQYGHEGSRLVAGHSTFNHAILVPIITIDEFCQQRKIPIVDILKIDAEGSDIDVIEGAKDTLRYRGVQLITAECYDCAGHRWHDMIQRLDKIFGFDCYVGGENDLLYRVTNCYDPSFMNLVPQFPPCFNTSMSYACRRYGVPAISRLDGNLFCAHRDRAHALANIFDGYSLYKYANKKRGNIFKDLFLDRLGVRFRHGDLFVDEWGHKEWEHNSGRSRHDGKITWRSIFDQCGCKGVAVEPPSIIPTAPPTSSSTRSLLKAKPTSQKAPAAKKVTSSQQHTKAKASPSPNRVQDTQSGPVGVGVTGPIGPTIVKFNKPGAGVVSAKVQVGSSSSSSSSSSSTETGGSSEALSISLWNYESQRGPGNHSSGHREQGREAAKRHSNHRDHFHQRVDRRGSTGADASISSSSSSVVSAGSNAGSSIGGHGRDRMRNAVREQQQQQWDQPEQLREHKKPGGHGGNGKHKPRPGFGKPQDVQDLQE